MADIHGFLDNLKAPIELVKFRAEYYRLIVTALLRSINVPVERLEFVLGSSYQLSEKYTMDLFRLSSVVTEHDAKRAGAEVVKQVENATLSGLLYPLMQALDEEHLDVDVQFGGVDQRKIFVLAAEQLPKVGYKERAHLMNSMVPGLAGGKMSASDPDSKIDLLDTPEVVKKKLKKAYAVPKEVEGNGIISFIEYVLLPISSLKSGGRGRFVVERRADQGDALVYESIDTLKQDYVADKVSSLCQSQNLTMYHSVKANHSSANPSTTQIQRNSRPRRPPRAHPSRLPSLERMAANRTASLPSSRSQEEREEGQG